MSNKVNVVGGGSTKDLDKWANVYKNIQQTDRGETTGGPTINTHEDRIGGGTADYEDEEG